MKILILSMAGIGDTLLATPFIKEMRLQYPEAEIDVLVFWAGSVDVLAGNPHVNRVYQKNFLKASKPEVFTFLNQLRARRYDLSINTHPQSRVYYRMIARHIGARERISHEYECDRWLNRWLVTRTTPQNYDLHSVSNNFRLLDLLGRKQLQSGVALEVFLDAGDQAWADQFITGRGLAGRQLIGFHVGSGGTKNLALKRWPLERHLELIQMVVERHPQAAILLFGGPQEKEDHRIIRERIPTPSVVMVEGNTLRQAAALMRRLDAFISVDTALMHLASAVRAPNQIVIEAPTLNATNLPFRPKTEFTIVPNPAVKGRNLEYYRYDGREIQGTREHLVECMMSVSAESVYAVLKERLG